MAVVELGSLKMSDLIKKAVAAGVSVDDVVRVRLAAVERQWRGGERSEKGHGKDVGGQGKKVKGCATVEEMQRQVKEKQ